MSTREELLKIKDKYKDYLLSTEGVTGIGVNGSIILYVESLDPKLLQFLPRTLDGVPVKYVKGKVRILGINAIPVAASVYADRVDRVRPVPGGVSIGREEATGTYTCKGFDKDTGEPHGITNNHVGALRWGDMQVGEVYDLLAQPGPADGGILPEDAIGGLDSWIPVEKDKPNIVDACRFKSMNLTDYIEEVGAPTPTMRPVAGMRMIVSSRTGLKYTTIIDADATLIVEGWGECTFEDTIVTQPAVLVPGDSGSWGGEIGTYANLALGYAGSADISAFNWMLNVEEMLNLFIVPPLAPISWTSIALPIGVMASFVTLARFGIDAIKSRGGKGIVV